MKTTNMEENMEEDIVENMEEDMREDMEEKKKEKTKETYERNKVLLLDYQKEELRLQSKELEEEHDTDTNNQHPLIIAFYAEKGGVGKTTNVISLAYTFAAKGKKVLLYDCDSQRSLTAELLGLKYLHLLNNDQNNSPLTIYLQEVWSRTNLKHSLYDQIQDSNRNPKAAYAIKIKQNIWLVPGDRATIELDEEFSRQEQMMSPQFGAHHRDEKTVKVYHSIMKTARNCKVDYVFLDLNPSRGSLNKILIMVSHYYIIPAIADFYSAEAMNYMSENLEKWFQSYIKLKKLHELSGSNSDLKFPDHYTKFLGYILNRIDSNKIGKYHEINQSFIQFDENGIEINQYRRIEECWIRKVQHGANAITNFFSNYSFEYRRHEYIPEGQGERINASLAISLNTYNRARRSNKLGVIREFWTLKNLSNIFHLPAHFLNNRHFIKCDRDDRIWPMDDEETFKRSKDIILFRNVFDNIYETIIRIIESDNYQLRN